MFKFKHNFFVWDATHRQLRYFPLASRAQWTSGAPAAFWAIIVASGWQHQPWIWPSVWQTCQTTEMYQVSLVRSKLCQFRSRYVFLLRPSKFGGKLLWISAWFLQPFAPTPKQRKIQSLLIYMNRSRTLVRETNGTRAIYATRGSPKCALIFWIWFSWQCRSMSSSGHHACLWSCDPQSPAQ